MQQAQQLHAQSLNQMMEQLQDAREGEAAQAKIVFDLQAELERLRSQKTVVQENKQDEVLFVFSDWPCCMHTLFHPAACFRSFLGPIRVVQALRRQRDELRRQLAASQAAANRAKELEIELRKLRMYVRDLETKHKRAEAQLKDEQAATGMARTQLKVAEDRVIESEQEKQALEKKFRDLQKKTAVQIKEIEIIKEKLSKEESEKVQLVLKLGKLKGQIGNLEQQAKKAKSESEAARGKLNSLQQKYDELMRKYKISQEQVGKYEKEVEKLKQEKDALESEVSRLKAEIQALKDLLAKRQEEDGSKVPLHELDKLKEQLQRALRDTEAATKETGRVTEQLDAAKSELEDLRRQLRTKNDEVAKLEREKNDIKEKVRRVEQGYCCRCS
jgi:protein QN1